MSLYERFSRGDEWALAIGRLMMASAHLEMSVLQAIARHGGIPLAQKAYPKPQSARLTILESLAKDRDNKTRESVRKIVELLRQFNTERNYVAHNPLMYALDDKSTEEHKYGAIMSIKDNRRIGLEEIQSLSAKARELAGHFAFAWMLAMGIGESAAQLDGTREPV